MSDAVANFAYSTVATAPSPATSGTSLVVATGTGTRFPTAPFNAVVWPVSSQPLSSNAEIVRVTAVSTDTLTITRAQESTSARTIVVGDQIAASVTAKTVNDIAQNSAVMQGAYTATSPLAQTFDINHVAGVSSSAGGIVSGSLGVYSIAIPAGVSIGHIGVLSGSTAAGTPTHYWFGLYDSSFVQLATTADQLTTAWSSFTEKSLAVATTAGGAASSFTTTYTGRYYIGVAMSATTMVTFWGATMGGISPTGYTPIVSGRSNTTGVTTPPAFPFTATAPTGGAAGYGQMIWAWVAA